MWAPNKGKILIAMSMIILELRTPSPGVSAQTPGDPDPPITQLVMFDITNLSSFH